MSQETTKRTQLYDLGADQIAHLMKAGRMLEPHLDRVLDNFYSTALTHPTAAEMFKDPAVLQHARDAQKRHWKWVFNGDFGEEYAKSCECVGRTHYRIQLPFELYFSSYSRAASDLIDTLIKGNGRLSNALSPTGLSQMICVLGRAFAMDSDLVIQAYFRAQSEELPYAFSFIEKGLVKLSNGDLSFEINHQTAPDFPAKYDDVRQTWNNSIRNLNSAMAEIVDGLERVKDSTVRLDDASDGLSTRTATQAASIEETSAAMQQLANSVADNAGNANQADSVSRDARTEVEQGANIMAETAQAMGRIQKASEEITKIISLIDDISFQTNLLALNAGVEAARAGEAGRGFAVVASEVRNLAASSSDAAQQIKNLIQRSSHEVNDGVKLVDSASEMLQKVVKQFDSVAQLASAVADSTSEQSTSLTEVTSAVGQMDQITQQNAGMAQDSSDEVKSLVQQIDALNDRISAFTLGQTQSGRMNKAA